MPPRPVLRRPDGPTVHPVRHPDLDGRAEPDQHPVTAIEGLAEWLADHIAAGANVTVTEADGVLTISASGGSGGGAVDSVNGETGVVVLDAGDVGADPAGTAAGLVDDLSGVTNAATARTNLGLGNVDNTSDANKPVSTAQQTALDAKAAASHSHSGADITSGMVATARLGSGTASASTYLRGDQTWAAVTPGASAINDLTDVDTATDPPATDDVLAWDGSLWTPAALTAADTGAIPASLIDAKGDLIVGTANDTAARLGVGTDGQVLTADSAQVGGVKWAAAAAGGGVPMLPAMSGVYYTMDGEVNSATWVSPSSAGVLHAHPVWLPAGNFNAVAVLIETAGTSTWRLGLYPADPTTLVPDGKALLKDFGTVTTSSTGMLVASSTAVTVATAGLFWVALLCDSYTSRPSAWGFRGDIGKSMSPPWLGSIRADGGLVRSQFPRRTTGVTTGAMPATCPTLGWNDICPQMSVRCA